MLLQTRGIVFRSIKYGETSVIADIFTEAEGLHSFIAGSVRTARSSMPMALFQPMTVIDIVSYYRNDANALNRLKEARVSEVYTKIPFELRRGAIALFMAEICQKCIHEAEPNPELFDFLLQKLRWLDTTESPVANMPLYFLIQLAEMLGLSIGIDADDTTYEQFFDLKTGVTTLIPPDHPMYFDGLQTARVLALSRLPIELCPEVPLTRPERRELLHGLLQFYQFHLPGFTGANTPDILEAIF